MRPNPVALPVSCCARERRTSHLFSDSSGISRIKLLIEQQPAGATAAAGLGTSLVPEVLLAGETQTPQLSVARSGVGANVVNRELISQSDTFAVSTRAAFWTHVTGGRPGDLVRHVWFHEDKQVGFVDLAIGSPSWRTTVAGPSYPEPRVTGPLRCGTRKDEFWPATSSAMNVIDSPRASNTEIFRGATARWP